MRHNVRSSVVLCLLLCAFTTDSYVRFCYFTNWSQYRQADGKFTPDDIDPTLCSHIVVAFLDLVEGVIKTREWNDEANIKKIVALKSRNPDLKVLLAVGGWNAGTLPFTQIVHSTSTRATFSSHVVPFLRGHKVDGLDLDWEYPANRGSPTRDKNLFTTWLKELRKIFDYEENASGLDRLLLTAAVGAGDYVTRTGYEVDKISKHLDYISLMAYDLHGSWEKNFGLNAPLYPRASENGTMKVDSKLNVIWAVDNWLSLGTPKEKLVLGVAFYGRTFTLCDEGGHNVGDLACMLSSNRAGVEGTYTKERGFLAYYEICQALNSSDWERKWHQEHRGPYAYNIKEKQWVGYDDTESLREKVNFAKQKKLAGIMMWSLDSDDFLNLCRKGKYPLLTAINEELGVQPTISISEGSTETARPNSNSNGKSRQNTTEDVREEKTSCAAGCILGLIIAALVVFYFVFFWAFAMVTYPLAVIGSASYQCLNNCHPGRKLISIYNSTTFKLSVLLAYKSNSEESEERSPEVKPYLKENSIYQNGTSDVGNGGFTIDNQVYHQPKPDIIVGRNDGNVSSVVDYATPTYMVQPHYDTPADLRHTHTQSHTETFI